MYGLLTEADAWQIVTLGAVAAAADHHREPPHPRPSASPRTTEGRRIRRDRDRGRLSATVTPIAHTSVTNRHSNNFILSFVVLCGQRAERTWLSPPHRVTALGRSAGEHASEDAVMRV